LQQFCGLAWTATKIVPQAILRLKHKAAPDQNCHGTGDAEDSSGIYRVAAEVGGSVLFQPTYQTI